MKRISTIIAILLLCMSMTACVMTGKPSENTGKYIDPNSEPIIIVDTEDVELLDRYDSYGKHIGYYQFTNGTNCDVYGIMLLEYLDMDGNVLKSFSPMFAGCTMDYAIDEEYANWNELTTICEVSRRGETSIEYIITPYTCGKLEMAIYKVDGTVNQVDIYEVDSEAVVTIKPSKEGNSLDVMSRGDDSLVVWEGCVDETYHRYTEREVYFGSDRSMICEASVSSKLLSGSNNVIYTRLEVKSSNGQTKRIYEQSMAGTQFNIGGYGDGTQLIISEYSVENKRVLYEIYDPVQDIVILKERMIYNDNGMYSHKDMEIYGGKVVTTESKYTGFYVKVEFYDAQGNLRKTVDTTQTGEYITLKWDKVNNNCMIEFYTEQGPTGACDWYDIAN